MASNVLPSIETGEPASPLPYGSECNSDDTYVSAEDETPMPDRGVERLLWIRKHRGESDFRKALAADEYTLKRQRAEEELERIEEEKVNAIRALQETDPWEYRTQMREYNLRLRGWTEERIEAARNRTISKEERAENWGAFSTLLGGRPLMYYGTPAGSTDVLDLVRPGVVERVASQPQHQELTKDISRKTRGSRITKSTTQGQSVANSDSQSQGAAPTPAEAPTPERQPKQPKRASDIIDKADDRDAQVPRKTRKRQPKEAASDAFDEIDDQILQAKAHNKRPRKAYKQERKSRRLAGLLPEFGMLPRRGEPARPYEPPMRYYQLQ